VVRDKYKERMIIKHQIYFRESQLANNMDSSRRQDRSKLIIRIIMKLPRLEQEKKKKQNSPNTGDR